MSDTGGAGSGDTGADTTPSTNDTRPTGLMAELGALKTWQTAFTTFLALVFWVIVIAIPSEAEPWSTAGRVVAGIAGGIAIIVGLLMLRSGVRKAGDERGQRFALAATSLVIGAVLLIFLLLSGQGLDFTDERRFAVGVGGLAFASFVFAVTRFSTLRVAASVPIVVLFVGIVTWPGASDIVGADLQSTMIKWMGAILAVNGAAEAVKQIGETNAKAKAQHPEQVTSTGDLGDLRG